MVFVQSLRGLSHTKLEDTKRSTWSSRCELSTGSPRRRSTVPRPARRTARTPRRRRRADSGDTSGRYVPGLEPDPAEVVDDERRERLARNDERHECRGTELRGGDDGRGDVERPESTADPHPPRRVADACP